MAQTFYRLGRWKARHGSMKKRFTQCLEMSGGRNSGEERWKLRPLLAWSFHPSIISSETAAWPLHLRGLGPVEQLPAAQPHAQSLHLPLWRVHGGARRRLTPAVGLAVPAVVGSQSARVAVTADTAGRDRAPNGDCGGGHRRGYVAVCRGAVAQPAVTIGACEA